MNTVRIVVITINYGHAAMTVDAVKHLLSLYPLTTHPDLHIVVVDNHSPDDSVSILQACLQDEERVTLVLSPINTGYSGGTNLGLAAAQGKNPDFVWLLNNDATPQPGALEALLSQAHATGGIVGSVIETPEKPPYAGGRVRWWRGSTFGVQRPPLDYVSAASMLIPWPVIEQLGPWDERYFLYVEDIEYCLRAKKRGVSVSRAPDSRVSHIKGHTTGGTANPVNQYYAYRNRLILFATYANSLQRFFIRLSYQRQLLGLMLRTCMPSKRKLQHREQLRIKGWAWLDFCQQRWGQCQRIFTVLDTTDTNAEMPHSGISAETDLLKATET